MTFEHVARAVWNQPWAIVEDRLAAICAVLQFRMEGGKLSADEVRDKVGIKEERVPFLALESGEVVKFSAAQPVPQLPAGSSAVAVLPLVGIIQQHASLLTDVSGPGATSTDMFTRRFREALAAPNVKAIVIDVDSPGGGIFGIDELSNEIYKARGLKKVVAVANSFCGSAAYWIASAAGEFAVAPSGQVGSIGVFAKHQEASQAEQAAGIKTTFITFGKYKAEADPSKPLTDEAIQATQQMVDAYGDMFVRAVARNRGVSAAAVTGGFGQGRMVMAKQALDEGMVDRIATLDQVLTKLGVRSAAPVAVAAAAENAAVVAAAVEADLAAAPDPDSVMRDVDIRRKQIELAGL